ncbi:hypothetical protein Bbelb_374000 [Branchiostoma belcheri]|nr:hypothetical protein Bbelb_374000 [Branchiostoma belcheri]
MADAQAAQLLEVDVDLAITSVLDDLDGISSLKNEQKDALNNFVRGKDVLGVLPTGFGKSLIYQLAPLVWKKLGRANPIVAVVTPLIALMEDQIREASKLGVSATQLGEDDEGVVEGKYMLVFGGPERWVLQEKWREVLSSATYRENLVGLVVDEVHGRRIERKACIQGSFQQTGRAQISGERRYTYRGFDRFSRHPVPRESDQSAEYAGSEEDKCISKQTEH